MRSYYLIPVAAVYAFTSSAFSQEITESIDGSDPAEITALPEARILGGISDGTRAPEEPKPAPIDMHVLESHTRAEHFRLAPEMAGLPAPEGVRNVTVQYVVAPDLPEDPEPRPAVQLTEEEIEAFRAEIAEQYQETQLVVISASVHKDGITRFQVQAPGPDAVPVTGWSNFDFHHLSGFTDFELKQPDGSYKRYAIIMGVGYVRDPDPEVRAPKLPALATDGPRFIVHKGDKNNPEGLELVEGLHALYAVEGQRLADAHAARKRAYEVRKAELLANPPKPKDVTIRFWDKPTAPAR